MADWKQVSEDSWEKVVVKEDAPKFGNKKIKVEVAILHPTGPTYKRNDGYEVFIKPQSKFIRTYEFPSYDRAASFATYYMDRYPNASTHPSQEEYSKF